MTVISLKDYAAQKNISYEAVRQQVVRYKDELEGHIIRDGRQQFLDEEAVAFLDAKRQKSPVALIQMDKDERIEELEDQVKKLLIKTAAQAERIAELAQWKADNAVLLASAEQTQLALDAAKKETEILEGYIQDAKAEIQTLTEEKAQELAAARQEAAEAALVAEQALSEAESAKASQKASETALEAIPKWLRKIFGA